MEKKFSNWIALIFVEVYLLAVIVFSLWGFFYAQIPDSQSLLFMVPIVYVVKFVFIGTAVMLTWLFFWFSKNWFKF